MTALLAEGVRASAEPEFIFNTLEVSGPREPLYEFLAAASGPGFINWRPDWYTVYEDIYFDLMRPGRSPSRLAADRLAHKLRDHLWRAHGRAQTSADQDPHRVPFDLNVLIPIPLKVLRSGFRAGGQEWIQANWGVPWPLRKVTLGMELRRDGADRVRQAAVFRFVSEEWSPGIAIARFRRRWSDLQFRLTAQYLEEIDERSGVTTGAD